MKCLRGSEGHSLLCLISIRHGLELRREHKVTCLDGYYVIYNTNCTSIYSIYIDCTEDWFGS